MTFQPDFIEPAHNVIAAAMVLIAHFFHPVLAAHERFDGAFLADDRGAHHGVLMHLHHRFDERRRAAGVADAPAGHRERLGKTVQKNRAFLHAGQARDADVFAFKREFGINFVAEDEQIFFDGELRDGFELRAVAGAAGGIARQIQHEQLAAGLPRGDQRFSGEREIILGKRRHGNRLAVRERDARMITHVARLVKHHLVAGIDQCADSNINRFGHTDRDDDFVLGPVADVEIVFDVTIDGAAQFDEAKVRGVVRLAFFQRVNRRFANMPGRVKIRLADAERDHVLHLRDDFKKVADARAGQVDDVSGDVTRGVHVAVSMQNGRMNIERRTSNAEHRTIRRAAIHSEFDVRCSMFDVPLFSSRRDLEPVVFLGFAFHENSRFLVGAQEKMRGSGKHAFERRKFFGNERGDALQARAVDEHEQIVAAGDEMAGFDLVEAADAFGEAIEAAAAFRRDADFDDGAHATFILGKIQHGPPAEQDAMLFQFVQLAVDLGFGNVEHLRHLRGGQTAAFQ
jgi:hypothetical protein